MLFQGGGGDIARRPAVCVKILAFIPCFDKRHQPVHDLSTSRKSAVCLFHSSAATTAGDVSFPFPYLSFPAAFLHVQHCIASNVQTHVASWRCMKVDGPDRKKNQHHNNDQIHDACHHAYSPHRNYRY
eukprot:3184187-Amphidinium_carterae.1